MSPNAPAYIFILGTGHSGGTLCNLLLGTSPSVFATGAGLQLWNLGGLYSQDDATRDFWSVAADRLAREGWAESSLSRERVLDAPMTLWKLWIETVDGLTDAPVLADKTMYLPLIRKICCEGLVRPFFVHLVRDSRAVGYSYFKKYGSNWRQARNWNTNHAEIEAFLAGRPSVRIRYEDLARDPDATVRTMLATAGDALGIDLVSGAPTDIANRTMDDPVFDNLVFAGNRMRHLENRVGRSIKLDTAFLDALPARDWAFATMLGLTRLHRYGYAVSRAATRRKISGA